MGEMGEEGSTYLTIAPPTTPGYRSPPPRHHPRQLYTSVGRTHTHSSDETDAHYISFCCFPGVSVADMRVDQPLLCISLSLSLSHTHTRERTSHRVDASHRRGGQRLYRRRSLPACSLRRRHLRRAVAVVLCCCRSEGGHRTHTHTHTHTHDHHASAAAAVV